MKRKIYFSGLCFELGQKERGLFHSALEAREFLKTSQDVIEIVDTGDIGHKKMHPRVKFFSSAELGQICWDPYVKSYEKTFNLLKNKETLLNWGGDHSVAISTVSAFVEHYPEGKIIWIDAHADLNVPGQSLTGNLHGMPMAVLLNLENIAQKKFSWIKRSLDPANVIYLGLRDLDPYELEEIEKLKISAYTGKDLRKFGLSRILKEVVDKVGQAPVHISFDIDSIDPRYAPATGVPVPDGLSPEDINSIGHEFNQKLNIKSVDVVEINPCIGNLLQVEQTFRIALQFLQNLLKYSGGSNEVFSTRTHSQLNLELQYTA